MTGHRLSTDAIAERWQALPCGVVYDPRIGYPAADIPAGTPFDELPDSWTCPICGAGKTDFVPLPEGSA
jgi:rubredoxin